MKYIVEIIQSIAWPITVLLAVWWLRKDISRVVTSLAKRMGDMSTDVDISKSGLRLSSRIDKVESKITSLEIDQDVVKPMVIEAARADGRLTNGDLVKDADGDKIPDLLQRMAEDYMAIKLPKYIERVREKDEMARRMANYVITQNISRDQLAKSVHEGIILALAATIHTFPESGDVERLLRVSDEVNRLHVKYRIVLAIGRLIERGFASKYEQIKSLRSVLNAFRRDADASLVARIDQTERLIDSEVQQIEA